jgi:Bacterial antitoxin of type II TA system, VapB
VNGTRLSRSKTAVSAALKEQLLTEAQRLGCHHSEEETVLAALEEYVRFRKQQNILCVYGDLEEEDELR